MRTCNFMYNCQIGPAKNNEQVQLCAIRSNLKMNGCDGDECIFQRILSTVKIIEMKGEG